MKLKFVCTALWGLAACLAAAPCLAQDNDWAAKMFDKSSHDFGVVAKGADARYRLTITNKYVQTVHIESVTTSCGCTAAKPSKDTLASRESAYVEIVMNTVRFDHDKNSSVIVRFDAPLAAEVRIPIHAYIRTDVVLTPGSAEFGAVSQGVEQERKITISYAGRDNWSIRDVINKNKDLDVKLHEVGRGAGRVNYELSVLLKPNAPVGALRGQLTLVTDDANSPQIPVLVEGKIEPEFTVTPEVVSFNILTPGEKRTVNVVVRGKKPFMIEKIESEKTSGAFEVRLPQSPKAIHVLPLTLIAPTEPGPVEEEFTLTIVGRPDPIHFKAYGKVQAQAQAAK